MPMPKIPEAPLPDRRTWIPEPVEASESVRYCPACRCKTWHLGGVCEWLDGHGEPGEP